METGNQVEGMNQVAAQAEYGGAQDEAAAEGN